jgi:uncharacterized flavoprotein (TIGR03862 family)
MAADVISAAGGVHVTLYDRMPTVGRKFLMAGRGGLNLTHGEDLEAFLARYGTRAPMMRAAIEAFPPSAVQAWCESLGQPTFVGSSGRVFPKAMKTSPLLRAWLKLLDERGVELRTRHHWSGWDDAGRLVFETPDGRQIVEADAVVLALGGASWPGLGSDGMWSPVLERAGIAVAPLVPSNCGFTVAWSQVMRKRFQGEPLKRIAVTHGSETVRGEAILTAAGIEGGVIYALSGPIRDAILSAGETTVTIDLRPDVRNEIIKRALEAGPGKQSFSSFIRKAAQLSPVAIGLLQEQAHATSAPLAKMTPTALAALLKSLPLRLTGVAPIARAISSAGGIAFDELRPDFMLARRAGVFVAGEMLDWEAPTGGYLLQACFSTGATAGKGVVNWLLRAAEARAP